MLRKLRAVAGFHRPVPGARNRIGVAIDVETTGLDYESDRCFPQHLALGCLSESLFDARRREVLALLGLDAETATVTGSDADGKGICGLLTRLIAMDDADVMRVLAVVMGETLEVRTGLIELLGQHMGVAMANVWRAPTSMFASDLLTAKWPRIRSNPVCLCERSAVHSGGMS